MAIFYGKTVDVAELFSDSVLEAGITESDSTSVLTIADPTQSKSAPSAMSIDYDAATTAAAYLRYTTGVGFPSVSGGFWHRTPQIPVNNRITFVHSLYNQAGTTFLTIRDERTAAGVRQIRVTVGAVEQTLAVAEQAWYWFTSKATNGGNALVNVYAENHALLAEWVFSGVPASDMNRFTVGRHATISATDIVGDAYSMTLL